MLDEEIPDPVPGSSGNKTIETKPKKKAVSAKRKDKEAAPLKKAEKAAAASKKASNETEPAKKVKAPSKKADKEAKPPTDKKKSMLDLICEALQVLGDGRKGASVQAIKKYIKSKSDSVAPNFNTMINKALTKGIEKGTLVRPTISKDATGAVGYFRLAKVDAPKRTVKKEKKKIDSEHASDSETIIKPPKPMKRNLSDTYIADMRNSLTSTPKPSAKQAATSKDIKQTKKVPKKTNADKDTSDSKIVVKKTKRKSMKSYSSDTEVDFKKSKTAKTPLKKTASDKPKTAKAGSPSKIPKANAKKLYNNTEVKGTKPAKTKAKKQA